MRLRRVGRIIGYALGALVALVALAEVGLLVWLRTDHAHALVRDRLLGFVNGKLGGRFTSEKLTGTLLTHVVLENNVLYDQDGHEAGHCRRIIVQYDLRTFIRHNGRIAHVWVEEPVFDAKPFAAKRVNVEQLTSWLRRRQHSLKINDLRLSDARVRVRPLRGPVETLEHADVHARLWLVNHSRWGR